MCVLILGHITPENRQEFFEAEASLKAKGYTVLNPVSAIPLCYYNDADYILRNQLQSLAYCRFIHALPNWHEMPNAAISQSIIKALNLKAI